MPRHIKKTPAKRTTKATRKKQPAKPAAPVKGSDRKPIRKPRGGYAHKGEVPVSPTPEQLSGVDLSVRYKAGETPEIVMYGRRMQVLSLMTRGEPPFNIISFCERAFGMSETQTRHIIYDIRAKWRSEMEEMTSSARAETIMRLRRDLSSMRAELQDGAGGKKAKVGWGDIARHEKLLSSIEGTQQPVRVTVYDGSEGMRDAVAAILSTMDNEQMETYVAHGYEVAEQLPSAAE